MSVGVIIGLLIGAVVAFLFKGITFADYIAKFSSIDFGESIVVTIVSILSFVASIMLLVILHEGGHLVCGLLSGYKFISFRVFNFTLIRINGHMHIKHFAVAGTGGQCLMSPPDIPLESIPVAWYNAGGVLANILALLIVLPLAWADNDPLVLAMIIIFILTDAFMIITNGIPMQIGGIGNDAYNILNLRHNLESKRGFVTQLRSNELIQNGVRPKDMPDEWFVCPPVINYKDPLSLSIYVMKASRLMDEYNWDDAYAAFDEIYSHKAEIMPLYTKEVACELAFLALMTGRKRRAEELLDKELMKYASNYRKIMSSKERLICAIELFINNDRDKAIAIYDTMYKCQSGYLLQGEVKSDLAIIERMLKQYNPQNTDRNDTY